MGLMMCEGKFVERSYPVRGIMPEKAVYLREKTVFSRYYTPVMPWLSDRSRLLLRLQRH